MTHSFTTTDDHDAALNTQAEKRGLPSADALFQNLVEAELDSLVEQCKAECFDELRAKSLPELQAMVMEVATPTP